MPPVDFDTDALIRANAGALGLPLDDERRAAVAVFVDICRDMAETLEAAPVAERSLHFASVFALPGAAGTVEDPR